MHWIHLQDLENHSLPRLLCLDWYHTVCFYLVMQNTSLIDWITHYMNSIAHHNFSSAEKRQKLVKPCRICVDRMQFWSQFRIECKFAMSKWAKLLHLITSQIYLLFTQKVFFLVSQIHRHIFSSWSFNDKSGEIQIVFPICPFDNVKQIFSRCFAGSLKFYDFYYFFCVLQNRGFAIPFL